jgi:hypothetical protein
VTKTKWHVKAIYLVVAVALVLGFALAPATPTQAAFGTYAGYDFYRDVTGTATWSTAAAHSGTYSVLFDAPAVGDYARVKIPITSAPFSTFAAPSFYYKDGGATATTADIGATWPMLVKSADTVTTGYLSPYPMLGIDNGVTPVTLIGQTWASSAAPATWTQWLNATASKVHTEALWHDGFTTDPALGGTIPAFYAPLSWWQTNASSPYKTGYNVLSVRVGLGYFGTGCAAQKAYVDTVSGSTYDLEPVAIEKACYNTGQTVNFKVLNGTASGILAINVASTTVPGGITIAASGTGGVFNGTLTLVGTTPGTGQLLVNNGDTVTVTYNGNWYAAGSTGSPGGPGALYFTAKVDDTAPVVTYTPADGTRVSGTTVNIASTITDTNIATCTNTLTINGVPKIFANPYVWNTTVGYPDATYTVVITSTDCAGNVGTVTKNYTVDNTPPTVTINQAAGPPAQADPTSTAPINFTVVFSEQVTGFATGDVLFTGSTAPGTLVGTVTGTGPYNVAVTGMTGSGNVIAIIPASVCTDTATPGNANLASTSTDNSVAYDVTTPTVNITSTAVVNGGATTTTPLPFTATFSEPVTGFVAGDITVTNAVTPVTNFAGGPTVYTFDVTPFHATLTTYVPTVNIAAAVAKDAALNDNLASTQNPFTFTFNVINPTCNLTRGVGGVDPTNAAIPVVATFSSAVTGFDATDITLSGAGGTGGTISGFTAVSGLIYNFNVNPAAQGVVNVKVNAGVCVDGASRPNLASNTFATTYDSVVPTVVITSPLTAGPLWNYTATFSETVTGFVVGDITGTNAAIANFAGTGAVYTFDVTSNPATDGTVVTVNIAAGVCNDAAGNLNTAAAPYIRSYIVNSNTKWGIQLAKGWNFISLPLIPGVLSEDNAIASVLSGVGNIANVLRVDYYYNTGTSTGWQTYMPGAGGTLTTMDDGNGYWMWMNAADTLTITGRTMPPAPAVPPTYPVYAGWNAIGFKSLTDNDNGLYLAGLTYTVMWEYNTATGYTLIYPPTTTHMNVGHGYWLWLATASGTIVPP